MRRAILFCRPLALCFLCVLPAHAADPLIWGEPDKWGSFEYDFEDSAKAWKEVEAQLPAYPKAADLIPIDISPTASNSYHVDYLSVSAGSDGVVRYTMLVKSPAGAETVSYEGLRCTTGERKLYAFGHAGGTWSRNRYARWEPIQARSQNSYHRVLFFHYFCTVEGAANLKAIQHLLKSGGSYNKD